MAINFLPGLKGGSQSTKDLIVSILSTEWPLTSKQVHSRVVKAQNFPVSYQAVHKLLRQMVENKVLERRGRTYLIDVHWLNDLENLAGKIKGLYSLKGEETGGAGRQGLLEQDGFLSGLGYLNAYKKKLLEKLQAEVKNFEAFEIQEVLLNDLSLGEKLGGKAIMQTADELISKFKARKRHAKWEAILALKELEDKEAITKKLAGILDQDKDAYMRGYAAMALGAIGSEKAFGILVKRFKKEKNDYALRRIIDVMGLFKKNETVEILDSFIKSKNRHLKYHALIALAKIDSEEPKKIVLKCLHSKDSIIRVEAAYGLKSTFGEKTALSDSILCHDAKHLAELLRTKDYVLQTHGIIAMGKTGSKAAVKPLIGFLDDKRNMGRWFAAIALSKIGDARAVKPIINFLKEPDNDCKYYAAIALSRLGREKTIKFLKPLFNHPDEEIRRFAIEATTPIEKKFLLTDFI